MRAFSLLRGYTEVGKQGSCARAEFRPNVYLRMRLRVYVRERKREREREREKEKEREGERYNNQ